MDKFYEPCEDSELLLKNAIKLIELSDKSQLNILEVGVGSGFVITNIAKKFKNKHIYFGCDINDDALKQTQIEFDKIKQKINLRKSDLFEKFSDENEFDIILFNTPYLPCEDGDSYEGLTILDKAIYGGKKGYEVIERFILEVGNFLNFNSLGLMVFSSQSNFDYIREILKKDFYSFEVMEKEGVFFEELIAIKFWRDEFYYDTLEKGVLNLKYLASGKHSVVYEGKYHLKDVVIKVGLDKDISIEKLYLEKLQNEKFVPRIYFAGKGFVIREKLNGDLIGDFLERANKKEITDVLDKVLVMTFRMDFLGINKKEMTNPYKHIYIIHKNNNFEVKMIDYERCIYTEKPKNTTQFLQYLKRQSKLLEKKGIKLNEEKILGVSKHFKQKIENKEKKLELIAIELEDLI